MKYILFIFFLFSIINPKIVFDKDEWINRLQELTTRSTQYKNEFPYNLLLYDGSNWWCDCNNLLKALFNERDIYDYTIGKYAWPLTNTGDVTCEGLIGKCTDVSSDFTALQEGEPRVLWMSGHIGTYIGKIVDEKYNVIECTPAWGGGVIYSWVDPDGTRRREKGGPAIKVWEKHGLPSLWVSY